MNEVDNQCQKDFEYFWEQNDYPDPSIKEFLTHVFKTGWNLGDMAGYVRGYKDAKRVFKKD